MDSIKVDPKKLDTREKLNNEGITRRTKKKE